MKRMNILELIKNEEVEWKEIGEIKEVKNISSYKKIANKDYLFNGNYPIIDQGSEFISGFTNDEKALHTDFPYVVFGDHTETVKYIDFKFAQGADGIKILKTDEKIIKSRYLYHVILNFYNISGKYKRHFSELKKTIIPIPSLQTQEKIVETLDKFTKCVTELKSELKSRVKQYNYYRDKMLSEDYLNKMELGSDIVEYKKLGEIGQFIRGNGLQKKDFQEEGYPVIHYGEIYTKYGFKALKTFSFTNKELFCKLCKANKHDILIATTSENMEDLGKCVVWLGDEEIGYSGDMCSYKTNENSEYIAYYMQTNKYQKEKEMKVTGTKVLRIHLDEMGKILIPLPPLYLQNKIVQILDKFQEYATDIEGLLPKEIELRQKQYEFYREKLLTFDENVVASKQASKQASKNN